ncbi:hypothetical protein GCK32_003609 [Trichostrongylus colubriformis]|uniref:Uncharacterized protein n=1 Tax=Trichostrongylus colubriformis TaxID=6319 RepID=A0AAN8G8T6_TRICO
MPMYAVSLKNTPKPSVVVPVAPKLGSLRRPTPEQDGDVHLVTPLSTSRPQSVIVELGIQTDDDFDRETALLVEQLVTSAISKARESLEKEAEIAQLRSQAQTYKDLFDKLQHSTKLTIEEKNKIIEALQKEETLRLTRSLAEETCKQITGSSMAHFEGTRKVAPKTRTIGLDTRSMNRHLTKLELMTAELEQDFFPWMFAKAERMFHQAMTSIELQNLLIRRSSFRRKKFEII